MLHSESFSTFFDTLTNTNDNDNKIQRRFSNQQIRSLETIFQFESKLEPRKKLQVAKDLGLQPRQVAIWFQNKRARWKSKQLERDYNVLKDSYDSLSSKYDLLNKENQSLTQQLKRLHEMMDKKEKSCSSLGNSSNSSEEINIEHDKGNMEKGNGDDWEDLECDQLLDGDTSNQWLDFWS